MPSVEQLMQDTSHEDLVPLVSQQHSLCELAANENISR